MNVNGQVRVLFLAVLMVAVSALSAAAFQQGDLAPDFTCRTLTGKSFTLSSLRGQPVVLKLATTWCPTCREQSEELEKAADFLEQHHVPVVEIFFQESDATVRSYLAKHSVKVHPIVMTDEGDVFGTYNVYLIPRLLLIDAQGVIQRDGGLLPADQLISQLSAMLK